MNNNNLELSSKATSKLSKLAITVELKLGQRIRVRDSIEDAAKILAITIPSENPEISAGNTELLAELSKDQLLFLESQGVLIDTPKKNKQLSYRGAALAPASKPTSRQKKSKAKSYRGVSRLD